MSKTHNVIGVVVIAGCIIYCSHRIEHKLDLLARLENTRYEVLFDRAEYIIKHYKSKT